MPVPRLPVIGEGHFGEGVTSQPGGIMDKRQLEALVKKNAAKAASATSTRKGFGKKYDVNLADDPIDEASLKERAGAEYRRCSVRQHGVARDLARARKIR